MNIKRWVQPKSPIKIRRVNGGDIMATMNNVFIVKDSMTNKFLEAFKKPMISKDFFDKCEKASKGINTNRKNK